MNKLEVASKYLMYRRVKPPAISDVVSISNSDDILMYIKQRVARLENGGAKIGLLLSGGIDSAILANFLPKGSIAYTFEYDEGIGYCEFELARKYIKDGIEHKKVIITKEEFFAESTKLTCLKKEPVVPHDPAVFIACKKAKNDGVTHMLIVDPEIKTMV